MSAIKSPIEAIIAGKYIKVSGLIIPFCFQLVGNTPNAVLYVPKICSTDRFVLNDATEYPFFQSPTQALNNAADNFVLFNKFQQLAEGMFLMSNEVFDDCFYDRSLLMKKDGKICEDDFSHELFMVVFPTGKEEDGYVIISSCSHSGVVNILNTARRTWEGAPVLGFVGGIHLTANGGKKLLCSLEEIEKIAEEIKEMDIGPIYLCHCTGQKGYERFKIHLGDQVQYLRAGEELEF